MKKILIILALALLILSGCQSNVALYRTYKSHNFYSKHDSITKIIDTYFTDVHMDLLKVDKEQEEKWHSIPFAKLDNGTDSKLADIINSLVNACYNLNFSEEISSDCFTTIMTSELSNKIISSGYLDQINVARQNLTTIIPEAIIIPNYYARIDGDKIETYSYIGVKSFGITDKGFLGLPKVEETDSYYQLIIYFAEDNSKYKIYKWVEIKRNFVKDVLEKNITIFNENDFNEEIQ